MPNPFDQFDTVNQFDQFDNPPPTEDVGIESMPSLEQEEPLTDRDEWGQPTIPEYFGELVSEVKETGLDFLGLLDVAKTVLTGAGSSIGVAAFGATAMLFGRDPEQTAHEVEYYSGAGTVMPWSDRGEELLEQIAVPLMKLEDSSTDLSGYLSGPIFGMPENPAAATAIKTELLGMFELFLPAKGSFRAMRAGRELRKRAEEMRALADDLGIKIKQDDLASSIVELANRMTPDQRAAHMPYLQRQLKIAAGMTRIRRNALYTQARASRTFVDADSAADLSSGIRQRLLDEGFDIDDMPKVNKRLKELGEMPVDETGMRINLKEFDNVRKRLNKNRSADVTENLALNTINRSMGKWLDAEFDKIAINQGSAISGESSGVAAWNAARAASRDWHKRFQEDKVIVNMISKDATPETMSQWLLGASVMGARREAATTINRMKAILGDDHPAIKGIRTDYLFEVAAPLLHPDGPNFNQFIRNYELWVERNPSLVKALDLDVGDFKELHDLARLQKTLPVDRAGPRDIIKRITTIVSRLTVGHEIAQAGVKVNLFRDALNITLQLDRITQKQMLYELAGLKYGDVMLPQGRPLAAQFIAGAALTEIADAQELDPSKD